MPNKLRSRSNLASSENLAKLGECARWGMLSTLFSLVYGHLLVATQLPPDPRQDGWLLMKSPLPTYIISVGYVLGVTCLAPKLMEDRRPVSGLRPVMVVYNALQVVISFWLLYEVAMAGWLTTYSYRCQTCDFSNSPEALRMLRAAYWYYVSKFADFLDTVFFLLNKKYEHISALHVVHHSLMPVNMWYGLRYQPGGHSSFMGFLNAFVHVVMYSYYLLAAMGPRVRPFLWWKKYLTALQMVQFIFVMVHSLQLLFIECPVPYQITWWIFGTSVMFLFLFSNFYLQAYIRASTKARTQEMNKVVNGFLGCYANGLTSPRGPPRDVPEMTCKVTELRQNKTLKNRREPSSLP
nr:elongation of very long chain fatty acids protein-like [Procambarus clarkii]